MSPRVCVNNKLTVKERATDLAALFMQLLGGLPVMIFKGERIRICRNNKEGSEK